MERAIEKLTEWLQSNGSQRTLEEKRLFHDSIVNSLKEALIVDFPERTRYCKYETYFRKLLEHLVALQDDSDDAKEKNIYLFQMKTKILMQKNRLEL
jgi:hypothetical protein